MIPALGGIIIVEYDTIRAAAQHARARSRGLAASHERAMRDRAAARPKALDGVERRPSPHARGPRGG